MTTHNLGTTELKIMPLVLGGNVFGWTIDEKQSFSILDQFIEAGFNAIDTADMYSRWAEGNQGGESETIIGKWMNERGLRNKIVLITKVGADVGQGGIDVSKKHISKAAEDSLRRLQTDRIDLYFTHFDNEETPVEETLEAYQALIEAGKVRYIGTSNMSEERIKQSMEAAEKNGLPKYQVLQPEHNLYDRQKFEQTYLPMARKYTLGVIPYFALASGFLTGKYRSEDDFGKSSRGGKMSKYLNERGKRILKALDELSEKHDTSQAAISLAWLMQHPDIAAPIASATKESHIKAFTDAARLQLSKEELEQLKQASAY